jgi:hypothetical protein
MKTLILLIVSALALSATSLTWLPGTYTITLTAEEAAFRDQNRLEWYPVGSPFTHSLLFTGPDGPGASVDFAPTVEWGLLLFSPAGTFWSQPGLNWDPQTHFVILSSGQIGVEDLPRSAWWCGEPDYNDMVLTLTSAVPESYSLILMALGLIGLSLLPRRR